MSAPYRNTKKIDSLNKLQDKKQNGNKKSNRTDRMRDKQIVLVHSMNREQDRTPGSFAAWNPVRGPKRGPQICPKRTQGRYLEVLEWGSKNGHPKKRSLQAGPEACKSISGARTADLYIYIYIYI